MWYSWDMKRGRKDPFGSHAVQVSFVDLSRGHCGRCLGPKLLSSIPMGVSQEMSEGYRQQEPQGCTVRLKEAKEAVDIEIRKGTMLCDS